MEKEDLSDRREYPRTPIDLQIEVVQILPEGLPPVEGIGRYTCRDISGGGISFYSMNSFPSQSILRLHLSLDELNIKVMGKVMWSKQLVVAPSCVIGVQFLNIYEQDFNALCSYIMTRCL
jgi:c-di-GMP-binding flagellar brake protein YcgR